MGCISITFVIKSLHKYYIRVKILIDFEWKEIKVCCEYLKNVCFDYVAKFPLQSSKP